MSKFTESIARFSDGQKWFHWCCHVGENIFKKPVFKCQDCGQCVLSYNAFTCPMRCPKQMRNGPCGGTRADGHCEVYPERHCIWWLIYRRSRRLGWQRKLRKYHIPVDRRFENTSAWINMFAGKILPLSFKKEPDDKEAPNKPQ